MRTACCARGGSRRTTAAFKKLVDSLADQYGEYTALPGLNVNGRLTLGENIGDLGGLSVAYEAYHHLAEGQASAGARRTDGRPALLPRLGAGVALALSATQRLRNLRS